ncbi:MAG TPA: rRNA methyltransferase, partial [Desulfovibrio sp.]|nr:rRNA methyltransferase [Desulfovibrio sp.]
MLDRLTVILVRPRYPENVGAAARACLNMGCLELRLVDPEEPDLERALPMATPHARGLLEQARIYPDLGAALTGLDAAFGTTARL